jgi:AcrR family transcriptional regulator
MTAEPKRRGRPRAYDPDAALQRASEIFWANGFDGVSLDDLAAATGMNRPSLYAAFGDKSDIYLKTLLRYQKANRAIGAAIVADEPPLRVFLARFYNSALDIYFSADHGARGCYSIGTAATRAIADPKVRAFLSESIQATDRFLAQRFALARERGEIAEDADPETLASLAAATLHTIAVRSRAGAPREQLQALAAAAIVAICGPDPRAAI